MRLLSQIVLWLLASALAVQLAGRAFGAWAPERLSGPIPGVLLPDLPVVDIRNGRRVNLGTSLADRGTCTLLSVVSVNCSVCKRLRGDWHESLEMAGWGSEEVSLVWVGVEGPDELRSFLESSPVYPHLNAVYSLRRRRHAMSRLGAFGTPLHYLVAPTGVVEFGSLGPSVPPFNDWRDKCGAQPSH